MALPEELRELAQRVSNWGRWGDDDQRGTLNLVTPASVLRGIAAVRDGRVLSLAIPFEADGPMWDFESMPGRVNPTLDAYFVNVSFTGDPSDFTTSDDTLRMGTPGRDPLGRPRPRRLRPPALQRRPRRRRRRARRLPARHRALRADRDPRRPRRRRPAPRRRPLRRRLPDHRRRPRGRDACRGDHGRVGGRAARPHRADGVPGPRGQAALLGPLPGPVGAGDRVAPRPRGGRRRDRHPAVRVLPRRGRAGVLPRPHDPAARTWAWCRGSCGRSTTSRPTARSTAATSSSSARAPCPWWAGSAPRSCRPRSSSPIGRCGPGAGVAPARRGLLRPTSGRSSVDTASRAP